MVNTAKHTLEELAAIKKNLSVPVKDLPLILEGLPDHISYTSVLGALFKQAKTTTSDGVLTLTKERVKKVVKHLTVVSQPRVAMYQKEYNEVIDSILQHAKDEVEDIIFEPKSKKVSKIEDFNVCMGGLSVATPAAMTKYFERIFENESEFILLSTPKHTDGDIVFISSEENAKRVTLLAEHFEGFNKASIDISLVFAYATTKLLRGGYDDEAFIDRIDISFFDAIKNGFIASKVLYYFSPMVDAEFDSMAKDFF